MIKILIDPKPKFKLADGKPFKVVFHNNAFQSNMPAERVMVRWLMNPENNKLIKRIISIS